MLFRSLSHHPSIEKSLTCEYTGALSRLQPTTNRSSNIDYEVAVLLSGPEPQRSYFEEACMNEAKRLNKKTIIVRGVPTEKSTTTIANITLVPHLSNDQLSEVLSQAKYIVCRSGYSTLMDLATLKKSALCIPTPGQTEQIYLANYLAEQHKIVVQAQGKMDWQEG